MDLATVSGRPRLAGRTALVTGGSRGIGAAVVQRLAACGAHVAFTFNASHAAASALAARLALDGHRVKAIRADLARDEDIDRVIDTIAHWSPRIDILVNNAAVATAGLVDDFDRQDLAAMMAVNVRAPFLLIQGLLPVMPAGGRIINIGSVSSDFMPYLGHSAYAMSKAALKGLAKGLVRELAERAIAINTVQPGRIETEMLHEILGASYDEVRRQMPLERFGRAEEVADLVSFLCEGNAGYVTGAEIRVDGGVSA